MRYNIMAGYHGYSKSNNADDFERVNNFMFEYDEAIRYGIDLE